MSSSSNTRPTHNETAVTPVPPVPVSSGSAQRISSASLLQGAPEVEIEHKGAVYRLRQTSQGKLILTK